MNKATKFKFIDIRFPNMWGSFAPMIEKKEHDIHYKIDGAIFKNGHLGVFFGVHVISKKKIKEENHPVYEVLIDSVGGFVFDRELPRLKRFNDIPFAANLLALMYPFIREKISYCFNANGIQIFLPPVNVFKLVEDFEKNNQIKLNDFRTDDNKVRN